MRPKDQKSPWGAVQVERSHYFAQQYLGPERFLGLQAQVSSCLAAAERARILEIGPGPGLLAALLRHLGYTVWTADFARDLAPEMVAQLPRLPVKPQAFDVVCAFEVLEHIPFELLPACLSEMWRVAGKQVIISVPDQKEIFTSFGDVRIRLGRFQLRRVLGRKPLGRITNPTEHYWEVGHDGVTPETVIQVAAEAGLALRSTSFVSPWFRFFTFDSIHA